MQVLHADVLAQCAPPCRGVLFTDSEMARAQMPRQRKKCPHPEVESLRLTFESLDTHCTGKISFEHFLLNSGMKGEVFKGFMR